MKTRIGLVLFLLFLIVEVGWIARGRFRHWSLLQLQRVRRNSQRIKTECGMVEYTMVGTGPVVLLLHGAPGGYDSWRLYADVSKSGYTLLSPSRPGYLRTPLRSGRTFVQQADLLKSLLDALGIKQVAVIGFSLGGPVALEFAHRYPEHVNRLVLNSAISHAYASDAPVEETLVGTSWLPQRLQSLLFWLSHRLLRYAPRIAIRSLIWGTYDGPDAQNCIDNILTLQEHRELLQAIFDSSVPLRHRQRGYNNDVRQLRQMQSIPLTGIRVPTLILHSRFDASVPFRHAEYANQYLHNSHLIAVDGCGHFLLIGPERNRIVHILTSFLSLDSLNAQSSPYHFLEP